MDIECNPIWQECSPILKASTQAPPLTSAPPKLESVVSAIRNFSTSSQPSCSTYPIWMLFLIWLTTETGAVVIDWIIHHIRARRIIEFPDIIDKLPPTGRLILLALLCLQHIIYNIVSVCAIVRNIHRERQQETVPMDPYEQV